jgi:WD40 repeat protein
MADSENRDCSQARSRQASSYAFGENSLEPKGRVGRARLSLLNRDLIVLLVLIGGPGLWLIAVSNTGPQARSHRPERPGHLARVNSLIFAPDGQTLASCGSDATVRLWNTDRLVDHERAIEAGADAVLPHASEVFAAAFSPDGRVLATLEVDRLSLWSCAPNGYSLEFQRATGSQLCLEWAPDARVLAVGIADGTIQLLDATDASLRKVLRGHDDMVRRLAFSPDGRVLASSGLDGKVKLWDVVLGAELRTIEESTGCFHAIAMAPDGNTLAMAKYGSGPSDIVLRDLMTSRVRSRLVGHLGGISALHYSRDGQVLASASLDRTIRLWNPEAGNSLEVLPVSEGRITAMALSMDGTRLAYSDGSVVRIPDLESAAPVRPGP